jgi:predicted PurR-regulated permease PerM
MLQLLLVVFILIEAPSMQERLGKGARETRLATRFGQIMTDIRRYISVVGWLGVLMAAPTTVFLLAMGVEGALLWGALAFLLSFVPAVGFIISLVPPVLWTFLQYHGSWQRAAIVAVGMIVINSIVDNVLRPRLVGKHLSISPLAIILSLLFWNFVLGPMGALMAIPLTVALKKALLDRFDETRVLAKLIEGGRGEGGNDAPSPAADETKTPQSP